MERSDHVKKKRTKELRKYTLSTDQSTLYPLCQQCSATADVYEYPPRLYLKTYML